MPSLPPTPPRTESFPPRHTVGAPGGPAPPLPAPQSGPRPVGAAGTALETSRMRPWPCLLSEFTPSHLTEPRTEIKGRKRTGCLEAAAPGAREGSARDGARKPVRPGSAPVLAQPTDRPCRAQRCTAPPARDFGGAELTPPCTLHPGSKDGAPRPLLGAAGRAAAPRAPWRVREDGGTALGHKLGWLGARPGPPWDGALHTCCLLSPPDGSVPQPRGPWQPWTTPQGLVLPRAKSPVV